MILACTNDNGGELDDVTVGDLILLTLTGTFEPETHHAGDVLVRGGMVRLFIFVVHETILLLFYLFDINFTGYLTPRKCFHCQNRCLRHSSSSDERYFSPFLLNLLLMFQVQKLSSIVILYVFLVL